MAKKAAKATPSKKTTGDVIQSKIEAEISKEFGEGIFRVSQKIIDNPPHVIPVSPAADIVLGGGIPEGSWVTCSGPPKCGKTSLGLKFAAECQKPEHGSRKVFYLDVEGRLKAMNLKGTKGLDPDKIAVIKSVKEKILTAEDWLDIAERIIRDEPSCLLIFDSVSAICDSKQMMDKANGQIRPMGPKLLSQFCKKMANVVPVNEVIVWLVQHLITDTSGKAGPRMMEDGGVKIDYQRDVKIRCKWIEKWEAGSGDNARIVGQKIHWSMLSSALGGIPGSQFTNHLRYGIGIDALQERIEIACNLGIFINSSKKPWYRFQGSGGEVACQGMEKLYTHFSENEADHQLLVKHIEEIFKPAGEEANES